jgi:Rrf2 family protein
MKFSTQEEYGLRLLLRIAREDSGKGLTIPELSESEGITVHNTAKLLRILRLGGFLVSSRGQIGGYALSKSPEIIFVKDVLNALGGRLYYDEFCTSFKGDQNICTNSVDCSLKSLWQLIQNAVDNITEKLTLADMINSGEQLITSITFGNKETIKL